MTYRIPPSLAGTVLAATLALGGALAGWSIPAEAAGLNGAAAAGPRHHGVRRADGGHARARHRRRRMAGFRFPRPFAAAGLPAGYSSDDSPFNVQADDDAFGTGAFYGCLHTVLTAGGYRPAATCD